LRYFIVVYHACFDEEDVVDSSYGELPLISKTFMNRNYVAHEIANRTGCSPEFVSVINIIEFKSKADFDEYYGNTRSRQKPRKDMSPEERSQTMYDMLIKDKGKGRKN
jgi:hypothetical protein